MVRARRYEYAVTGANFFGLDAHGHLPGSLENKIHLLWNVTVNSLDATRFDFNQCGCQMFGIRSAC